jgi:cation transport regulator ChaC
LLVISLGILAYGSLIDDPGAELQEIITDRLPGVTTPFGIEFARTSRTRDGAPVLVPVSEGGEPVAGVVLVLEDGISEQEAMDRLYRREIHQVGCGERYNHPRDGDLNRMRIGRCANLAGVKTLLYASFQQNIPNPTPEQLGRLAIESAKASAGKRGKDGIRYLIDAGRNGIRTPLMDGYRREILRQTGTHSLADALRIARQAG